MATFVHARRRDGEVVFRIWNTVVDRYENPEPLSRECGRFHHEFELNESDGLCGNCGESHGDDAHLPACPEGTRAERSDTR